MALHHDETCNAENCTLGNDERERSLPNPTPVDRGVFGSDVIGYVYASKPHLTFELFADKVEEYPMRKGDGELRVRQGMATRNARRNSRAKEIRTIKKEKSLEDLSEPVVVEGLSPKAKRAKTVKAKKAAAEGIPAKCPRKYTAEELADIE